MAIDAKPNQYRIDNICPETHLNFLFFDYFLCLLAGTIVPHGNVLESFLNQQDSSQGKKELL
jgi:hypothetical protein